MRLWHKDLIPVLPNKQLCGQWKEIFQIMGSIEKLGTPRHGLVNKVMDYPGIHFINYSRLIYGEMIQRGFKPKKEKLNDLMIRVANCDDFPQYRLVSSLYHDWHNERYFNQCFTNLEEKYDCELIPHDQWVKVFQLKLERGGY